jgi:tRNA U34 5-methylaminomethyl-2-thiouridine-forming methyltransferase MnmC
MSPVFFTPETMNNPENPENLFETELIETADGSHTLKLKGIDEQYHSIKGALQESNHVFLQNGFKALTSSSDSVKILEIGSGTGLNALITAREAIINQRQIIFYDAIEPYPVAFELLHKLNYPKLFEENWIKTVFQQIHSAGADTFLEVEKHFFIRNIRQKIEEANIGNDYDLVYFDAFGPDTQPELWTQQIFDLIASKMKPNAILVTYCVKGSVRRAMKSAGFDVQKLPGPPGKREISRATRL